MADLRDPANRAELKRLHPPCASALPPLPDGAPVVVVAADDELAKFIRQRAKGAAPGPSGWTDDLLAQLATDGDCLHGIATLIAGLRNGRVPAVCKPFLNGAALVALQKKPTGLRPIASGECMWRLAAAHAVDAYASEARALLAPYQFGVGQPGGAEHIVHAMQAALEDDRGERHAGVTLDFANAFNALDRGAMLRAV